MAACPKASLAMAGLGSSAVTIRHPNAPAYGTDPQAMRVTATSGPLKGGEITLVTTGIGDTLLAMTFVGAVPADIDGATNLAVEKATANLPTKTPS
jgi:hypothetical protein